MADIIEDEVMMVDMHELKMKALAKIDKALSMELDADVTVQYIMAFASVAALETVSERIVAPITQVEKAKV